jgi:hypothetical protein
MEHNKCIPHILLTKKYVSMGLMTIYNKICHCVVIFEHNIIFIYNKTYFNGNERLYTERVC